MTNTMILDQIRFVIIEVDEIVCDPDRDHEFLEEAVDDLNRMLHALDEDDTSIGSLITSTLALATDIISF